MSSPFLTYYKVIQRRVDDKLALRNLCPRLYTRHSLYSKYFFFFYVDKKDRSRLISQHYNLRQRYTFRIHFIAHKLLRSTVGHRNSSYSPSGRCLPSSSTSNHQRLLPSTCLPLPSQILTSAPGISQWTLRGVLSIFHLVCTTNSCVQLYIPVPLSQIEGNYFPIIMLAVERKEGMPVIILPASLHSYRTFFRPCFVLLQYLSILVPPPQYILYFSLLYVDDVT